MGARLYARTQGWSSHVVVSRGFERALAHHGVLDGVFAVDEEPDLDDEPPPGAGAKYGVFTGPAPAVLRLRHNADHAQRLGMLAPNSDRVPAIIMQQYESVCTELLAPSEWAAEVLRNLTKLPVTSVPHGVDPAYRPDPEWRRVVAQNYTEGRFDVLHLSTSDRERKGTLQLVLAWQRLREQGSLPPDAKLTLLLDSRALTRLYDELEDEGTFLPGQVHIVQRVIAGDGVPPERMAKFYSEFHLICQPSRGEAFGLCPLEARACGVPVLATRCTGHSEHMPGPNEDCFEHGALVIEHGPDAPIDDLPEARGPSVTVESVAAGLEIACAMWERINAAALSRAAEVGARWTWENQLAPLARRLEA